MERKTHLISGYTLGGRRVRRVRRFARRFIPGLGWAWYRKNWSHPSPACKGRKIRKRDMVSVYDNPDTESLINCDECLAWLNDPKGMHRLMVTKGGMDEYLRRLIREEPGTLRYTDIPSGNTGVVESEDDLPQREDDE